MLKFKVVQLQSGRFALLLDAWNEGKSGAEPTIIWYDEVDGEICIGPALDRVAKTLGGLNIGRSNGLITIMTDSSFAIGPLPTPKEPS